MNRSMPCSKKRSGEQRKPEPWPDPTRNAHCGSNTRSDSHTTHRSGQILWPNHFNMKTAPKKQAEGSLTLAKEGPEPETIRSGNQINEIDLVGEQAAQHFRERGASAGDWGSACSMLEHHLVTRSKNRFLQTWYGLLRKHVCSVTEILLRCPSTGTSNREHPSSFGSLASDVTNNPEESSPDCVLLQN